MPTTYHYHHFIYHSTIPHRLQPYFLFIFIHYDRLTALSTIPGCRQPNYGPHESKIIMEHIQALLKNDWIEECKGPWGSLIVLAPKPHQEHVTDINDFIW